jgi:hypothetical protein
MQARPNPMHEEQATQVDSPTLTYMIGETTIQRALLIAMVQSSTVSSTLVSNSGALSTAGLSMSTPTPPEGRRPLIIKSDCLINMDDCRSKKSFRCQDIVGLKA